MLVEALNMGRFLRRLPLIVDGIIGIPHIEMNPIIGEFTFWTIPVVECIRERGE